MTYGKEFVIEYPALAALGFVTPDMADPYESRQYLKPLMEKINSGYSLIVCVIGLTGIGKSTVLADTLKFISYRSKTDLVKKTLILDTSINEELASKGKRREDITGEDTRAASLRFREKGIWAIKNLPRPFVLGCETLGLTSTSGALDLQAIQKSVKETDSPILFRVISFPPNQQIIDLADQVRTLIEEGDLETIKSLARALNKMSKKGNGLLGKPGTDGGRAIEGRRVRKRMKEIVTGSEELGLWYIGEYTKRIGIDYFGEDFHYFDEYRFRRGIEYDELKPENFL